MGVLMDGPRLRSFPPTLGKLAINNQHQFVAIQDYSWIVWTVRFLLSGHYPVTISWISKQTTIPEIALV
jgi:hypothetical protein